MGLLALFRPIVGELFPEASSRAGTRLDGLVATLVAVREQDAWHMRRNLVENATRHIPRGTAITLGFHRAYRRLLAEGGGR